MHGAIRDHRISERTVIWKMKLKPIEKAESYLRMRKRNRRYRKFLIFLSSAVALCTTYVLVSPAITMESQCQLEEHVHTDECYELVSGTYISKPLCGAETLDIHIHDAECYDSSGELICAYADFVVHEHDSTCYLVDGSLWCTLPEIKAHTHDSSCYARGHSHTDECYLVSRVELICTEHEHTQECYAQHEELICSIGEDDGHSHDDSCYETFSELVCGIDSGHVHTDECYELEKKLICQLETAQNEAGSELICGKDEIILHEHQPYVSELDPGCYDAEGRLICGMTQVLEHVHGGECFSDVWEAWDTQELTCTETDENHVHSRCCYGTWKLICDKQEHEHDRSCILSQNETEYTCGIDEHEHGDYCFDTQGELTCEEQEHEHDASCTASGGLSGDELKVQSVISMISLLPGEEELASLYAAAEEGDAEALEQLEAVRLEALSAWVYYEELDPDLQEQVDNRETLLSLQWMFAGDTLENTDTVTVYQVNKYSSGSHTLVYSSTSGKTVKDILGSGMGFTYWDAVTVKNESGMLVVSAIQTEDGSKLNLVIPQNGFILLVYNKTVSAAVGNYVSVDFDYTTTATSSAGLGTLTFSDSAPIKAEKDNSSKLSIVPSADTSGIITVNLYDYNSTINTLYNSNKNYPGFQQDGGEKVAYVTSTAYSNFGNNITVDLAAGTTGVTRGTGINSISDNANSPISGAMYSKLKDGYPALASGESLKYLWSNSEYATKVNTSSINGLFRYDESTGTYFFNSRLNHAQYSNNRFTLYNQVLTANFTYYPFGNFLPFNDIVHDSAQVSTIDRSYLSSIAATALYKANNGYGTEYQTLYEAMNKWIGLMDVKFGSSWTASDAVNEFFNSGIGPNGSSGGFKFADSELSNIYCLDYDVPTDFYFGMEIKMNFLQPKSGMVGADKTTPMVFEFSGDDDVWVYIDNVLVLDLSGIHRHVGGKIDFSTGKIYYQSLNPATGDVGDYVYKTCFADLGLTVDSSGRLPDFSSHSFAFYYMERGAGSGVCEMKFNLYTLRENMIAIMKELSSDESVDDILGEPDFFFQVLKVAEDGSRTEEPYIDENTSYTVYDRTGQKVGTGVTGENGIIKIKAGQVAVLDHIPESKGRYYVRELLDTKYYEQYGAISVSGNTTTEFNDVVVGQQSFKGVVSPIADSSTGTTVFRFDNRLTTSKLGSLNITKKLENSSGQNGDSFDIYVTLSGQALPVGTVYSVAGEERSVVSPGIVSIAADETAVIDNIIVGTEWSVSETEVSSAGYNVRYYVDGSEVSSASGTIGLSQNVEISVNNDELGASLEIPVYKNLLCPDEKEHTYRFRLEQVTDQTGQSVSDAGLSKTLDITITDTAAEGKFRLNYPAEGFDSLPLTLYYKISEQSVPEEDKTIFDDSVYVIKVVLSNANGQLRAEITDIWKDGELLQNPDEGTDMIVFTNEIISYRLPETGDCGLWYFFVGGALLVLMGTAILIRQRKNVMIHERNGKDET